jgi:hypothetical protein
MAHHGEGKSLRDDRVRAAINMANIPVSGDVPGLIFALATALIFFLGIPAIRWMFPAAIVLGCGIAVVLHFIHHGERDKPLGIVSTLNRGDGKSG